MTRCANPFARCVVTRAASPVSSLADFHRAVREIAAGEYFTTQVTVTEHAVATGNRIVIEYSAYLADRAVNGWTDRHATPEACLAELRAMPREVTERQPVDESPLEALGDVEVPA